MQHSNAEKSLQKLPRNDHSSDCRGVFDVETAQSRNTDQLTLQDQQFI